MTQLDAMVADHMEQARNRCYGKYRGFVTNNKDEQQRGRVRLKVPALFGDAELGWAEPCLPFGGLPEQGFFAIPEVGAQVWVEFEAGDPDKPIWTGAFWPQQADVPAEAQKAEPTTRLLKTPSGHMLQFDDAKGEERIRLSHRTGAQLSVESDGSLTLTNAKGARITLHADGGKVVVDDANGNTLTMHKAGTVLKDSSGSEIEMTGAGINIKAKSSVTVDAAQVLLGGAGGEPLLRGTTFFTMFCGHTHAVNLPLLQTTPPIFPPGNPFALKVMAT
jgi:uncharacterized protein involved in type VI secretion and phage assembly